MSYGSGALVTLECYFKRLDVLAENQIQLPVAFFFYECTDDKRLGLWLKTALDATYVKTWRFIYSVYHGKCLSWALSHFYAGANDADPPTCFVGNNPLCSVCEHTVLRPYVRRVLTFKNTCNCCFKQ